MKARMDNNLEQRHGMTMMTKMVNVQIRVQLTF